MKFSVTGAIAALALSSVTSAYLVPRQDAGNQDQNQVTSQYPPTDLGSLNGTCKYINKKYKK